MPFSEQCKSFLFKWIKTGATRDRG